MDVLKAIAGRRSIRKFKDKPIPDEAIQAILTAAIQAPSGKNRQPWRFVVVTGDKCAEMVRIMREGIAEKEAREEDIGSTKGTARAMEEAPVTVFVFNQHGVAPWLEHSVDQTFKDVVNLQSIGAAIQNMALAAQGLGIGSLWICDVFCAYEELQEWLGEEGQMVAAMSFGYADESPGARPRKPIREVARWLSDNT
ncbi:MAG: nitroreductase [Anaerolineae bacterium]|nr:nitroreductase [Anaerolineae bacterium]